MPRPSEDNELVEIIRHYLSLYTKPSRQKDFENTEARFQQVLIKINDAAKIQAALAADKNNKLPVQIKSPAYERLLVLKGRSVGLLREYAQTMFDYGPEWNVYAQSLWQEAKLLKQKEEEEEI
jgi:hypothetical protein